MAATKDVMARKIEELSKAIEKNNQATEINATSEDLHSLLSSSQESILESFKLGDQKVSFVLDESGQVHVILERKNKRFIIPKEDIEGIPRECFSDHSKMKAFLSGSHVNVTEYLDGKGFKVRVNLKLMGGGHLGKVGDEYGEIAKPWPVIGNKIVIPYEIQGKPEAVSLWNSGKVVPSHRGDIKNEHTAATAIFLAIKRWNETNLVELLNIYIDPSSGTSEYQQKHGYQPTEFVQFYSYKTTELCRSSCIGKCQFSVPQAVECDLSGLFKEDPSQSIMHEIGHVIGLRHEHTRFDRGLFVQTNLPEIVGQNSEKVGPYDFDSIMHYALSENLNGGDGHLYYLRRASPLHPAYNQAISNYTKTIADDKVGKREVISNGDREAVKQLRTLYLGWNR
jgi:predicted Zn-dependent protease